MRGDEKTSPRITRMSADYEDLRKRTGRRKLREQSNPVFLIRVHPRNPRREIFVSDTIAQSAG